MLLSNDLYNHLHNRTRCPDHELQCSVIRKQQCHTDYRWCNRCYPFKICGLCYIYLHSLCSDKPSNDTIPASLVLSSQLSDYDSGEMDTNETVELTFPIKVDIYECISALIKKRSIKGQMSCSEII